MPTGNLPESGKKLWERVYESSLNGSCKGDKECAARTAWKAVHNAGWYKDDSGSWKKKDVLQEFSMYISKASYDAKADEMRWAATASDTDRDVFQDKMSLPLFNDFIIRASVKEKPPERYCSEFWSGGLPYLSLSHYLDLNGEASPGITTELYVDGEYLKAKGIFSSTELGKKCYFAVKSDFVGPPHPDGKIRISIAFLDLEHKHLSNGYIFKRESWEDVCLECIKEQISGEYSGREFIRGLLVHLALTRVPANKRTSVEVDKMAIETKEQDAASIVGDEEAKKIAEMAQEMVGKSELIIKSETEDMDDDEKKEVEEETPSGEEAPKEEPEEEEKSVSDPIMETLSTVLRILGEIQESFKSLSLPVKAEVDQHPLEPSFDVLKASYDQIVKDSPTPEQALSLLQVPFNQFGNDFASQVHKSVVVPQAPEAPVSIVNTNQVDIVSALSSVMQPVVQKLDALLEQKSAQPASFQPIVPQRRNIAPPPPTLTPNPVVKSKLREIVERTT